MSDFSPRPSDFAAPTGSVDLLVIAGEHSGDEHAAKLVEEIKSGRPDYNVACLGGIELRAAGAQLLYDLTAVSIVGFVEVVKNYSFFRDLFNRTLDWIEQYRPKHICFVDYPGFNLRLAAQLHERGLSRKGGGEIALSYYIGPQVWAWKAKRRFKMADYLDQLGVIFPFEVECFSDTELPTEFVGHPFIREDFEPPFVYDPEAPVLLLPGSRHIPISRIFPVLLEGFERALEQVPDLKARVVYPNEPILAQLRLILAEYPNLIDRVEFAENSKKCIPASAVLMSSGTMSLAVALSGIPGAIAYRLHPLSYWIGRFLVKIPYIGISNLLLDHPLHPEYIQNAASAEQLAAEVLRSRDSAAENETSEAAKELRKILSPDSNVGAVEWLSRLD